jgi:hypothetical protein
MLMYPPAHLKGLQICMRLIDNTTVGSLPACQAIPQQEAWEEPSDYYKTCDII